LKNGDLDAGYVAHPSLLTNKELGTIEKPFSIAAAGWIFPLLSTS
jgi:hypothetical protein